MEPTTQTTKVRTTVSIIIIVILVLALGLFIYVKGWFGSRTETPYNTIGAPSGDTTDTASSSGDVDTAPANAKG